MTINQSLSDQIADQIVAKVKRGASKDRTKGKKQEKPKMEYYVAHYNYETDIYKWTASIRYSVNAGEDPDTIAHEVISGRWPDRHYQLMYTKKEG